MRAAALVVAADAERQPALETLAQEAGFWTRCARTVEEALPLLEGVDLCILDAALEEAVGVLSHGAGRQILLVGGAGASGADAPDVTRVEADEGRLCEALRQLRRVVAAEQRALALRNALVGPDRFDLLVGRSDEMHRLWDRMLACADDARPVLVLGPPGAGKQAIARTLHRVGRRADGPLVRVDCARPGELGSLAAAIDEARGGALLLAHADAVPHGEDRLAKVWAGQDPSAPRVIATAERAPAPEPGGAFWGRFDAHRLELSPLASRPDDVGVLAEHFLQEICRSLGVRRRWSCAALARLEREPWPGNARELKQFVGRAVLDAPGAPADGGLTLRGVDDSLESDALEVRVGSSIEAVERRLILATLAACRGNKPHAARILGISLKTLYNRLSVYRGSTSVDAAPR